LYEREPETEKSCSRARTGHCDVSDSGHVLFSKKNLKKFPNFGQFLPSEQKCARKK
jgi:hypothetical protein